LATACGGKGLTMLAAQPVCHSAFDGDVRLSKYYARIIRDGRFLRILAGIDSLVTFATKSYRRVHVSASGSPELSHPV
jgi:hypothetical protein